MRWTRAYFEDVAEYVRPELGFPGDHERDEMRHEWRYEVGRGREDRSEQFVLQCVREEVLHRFRRDEVVEFLVEVAAGIIGGIEDSWSDRGTIYRGDWHNRLSTNAIPIWFDEQISMSSECS